MALFSHKMGLYSEDLFPVNYFNCLCVVDRYLPIQWCIIRNELNLALMQIKAPQVSEIAKHSFELTGLICAYEKYVRTFSLISHCAIDEDHQKSSNVWTFSGAFLQNTICYLFYFFGKPSDYFEEMPDK